MAKAEEILDLALDAGFDKSEINEDTEGVVIICSQCEALVINGTPTHESSCPNKK
jgi:hypothetical protein